MVRAASTWRGWRSVTRGSGDPSSETVTEVSAPQLLGAVVTIRWTDDAVIEAK